MNNYNSKISILGVNPGHDASFCGVDSKGTTQWIFEEERFNRIKHSNFITFDSLKIQIKDKLLNPLDVDLIAYCFEIEPNLVESLYNRCHNNIHSEFGQNIVDDLNNQYLIENDAAFIIPLEELGQNQTSDKTSQKLHQLFPKAKIHGYNHHLSHAASTFFPSPFSESAVLIVDGAGLLETATIWHCSGDTTKEVFRIELPHSLGIFYEVVSHALCLEEGKVMGLSSFGNPRFVSNLRKNVIDVDEKMGFRYLAPIISHGDIETTEYACQELLRHIPIKRRSHSTDPISQEHADLAASAQQITEIILLIQDHVLLD